VNLLLKNYVEMRQMMSQLQLGKMPGMVGRLAGRNAKKRAKKKKRKR
jgi:hypothetical protein